MPKYKEHAMEASIATRVRRSLRGCRPQLSFRLCLFEEEFCLDLFGFLIALPLLDRWHREPHEVMESWGFYFFDRAFVLAWGSKTRHFDLPWHLEHQNNKHMVLRTDGTWGPEARHWYKDWTRELAPDGRQIWQFTYRYTLRSGEVQERTASVFVERREWRQKWLQWCPLFALKRQSIEVQFSDEVGERTGSWKGGCIGCGYGMLPGETAEDTLRRMEREREFT